MLKRPAAGLDLEKRVVSDLQVSTLSDRGITDWYKKYQRKMKSLRTCSV